MKKLITASIFFFFLSNSFAQSLPGSGKSYQGANARYIQIPNSTQINSFPVTITAWIKVANSGSSAHQIIYYSEDRPSQGYYGVRFQVGPNMNLLLTYGSGTGCFSNSCQRYWSAFIPTAYANQWIHVAGVMNSATSGVMYLNGTALSSTFHGSGAPVIGSLPNPTATIGMATNGSTPASYFLGEMDEVTVWTTARTQSQIREMMCKKTPINSPGLVSYYKFDEASGSTFIDSGPAGKNGNIVGTATRNISSAPIGDESANFYPPTASPVMQWVNTSNDTIRIVNHQGVNEGIHVYTVNSAPNHSNGVNITCASNRYHGVFVTSQNSDLVTYQVQFRPSGGVGSISYWRLNNSTTSWTFNTALPMPSGFNWNTFGRKEFLTGTGPIAGFTQNVNVKSVQFTSTTPTTTGPLTYAWNFGDGATSTLTNPQHTYALEGTYQVCLTVTDTCGSTTFCNSVAIVCSVVAGFQTQISGTTVSFTNQSTGVGSLQHAWAFGDGSTSTQPNPQHFYATAGTYQVCLTTTDNCGTRTTCQSITVTCAATAAFQTQINGTLVSTTNQSTGIGTLQYLWNFGDGTTSTLPNPQHFYTASGNYQICLTVTDTCGSANFCTNVFVSCVGMADFTHQVQPGTTTVNFSDQSVGTGTLQYLWTFSNGTTSTLQNPVVNFGQEATFYACLQVTDSCGVFTHCDSVAVSCGGLNADYYFLQNNLSVQFFNVSTGTGTMSYMWTFGDGGFSFNPNPTYIYQNEGTYQVCLQTTDTCGVRSKCYSLDICIEPSNMFTANNTQGFTFNFVPVTQNALSYLWDFGDGNFSVAASPIYTYQTKGLYQVCMQLNDDCGHADTCIDVLASLIGIHEIDAENKYIAYPNPASEFLTIPNLPIGEDFTFEIINALGAQVMRGFISAEKTIDISHLPQGAYILKLDDKQGRSMPQKIQIIR